MTAKKKSLVFIIIICCLLMVPVFLTCPAASAQQGEAVAISGNIPLVTYNVSVTGIDWTNAIVAWNTNENANSTVEYGTTTSYGSFSTDGAIAENHMISLYNLLPGTVYHYVVISADLTGNRASSSDSTFTTTAIPVTVTPTAHGGGGGGGGGGNGNNGLGPVAPQPANPFGQPLLAPLEQMLGGPSPVVAPTMAAVPGLPAASAIYPVGFPGLIYNANGDGTLIIDTGAANAAGATITMYADHITVYQHHSPGVLLTFWGDDFGINNGTITGPVSRAELLTDPLNATLALGNVTGSVHAALPELIGWGNITLTISENMSTDTLNQFQDILTGNGLQLNTVAYTLDVQKVNLTTGPANVTFTVPSSWVNEHGGKDAVMITRVSEETDKQELLNTVYEGVDTQGNMIFRGDSPNGTSLFGLVTAGQKAYLNGIFVGLIGVIALLAVITAYFGWWKRRL